jgi:hypothetical protein
MPRPDDEDREEGFLGRWARRKRETLIPAPDRQIDTQQGNGAATGSLSRNGGEMERGPAPQSTSVGSAPSQPSPVPGEGSRAGASSVKTESVQAEPEMVEPPSLDLVDKDFDLAHWLKQNVPEEWKLKALRRAWESDPAISGYLDPARDYALDWNTPGGAPGYGPLSESDNVEEMLANIFGKPPEPAAEQGEAVRNDVAVVQPSSNEAGDADSAAPQQGVARAADDLQPVRLSDEGVSRKSAENATETAGSSGGSSVAAQKAPEIQLSQQRSRRRGGGATPL